MVTGSRNGRSWVHSQKTSRLWFAFSSDRSGNWITPSRIVLFTWNLVMHG